MFVCKLGTPSCSNYEHFHVYLAYRRHTGTVVTRQTYDRAPRQTKPPINKYTFQGVELSIPGSIDVAVQIAKLLNLISRSDNEGVPQTYIVIKFRDLSKPFQIPVHANLYRPPSHCHGRMTYCTYWNHCPRNPEDVQMRSCTHSPKISMCPHCSCFL